MAGFDTMNFRTTKVRAGYHLFECVWRTGHDDCNCLDLMVSDMGDLLGHVKQRSWLLGIATPSASVMRDKTCKPHDNIVPCVICWHNGNPKSGR